MSPALISFPPSELPWLGGSWEGSTLREGTGGKTRVERDNKDLLELERREGK